MKYPTIDSSFRTIENTTEIPQEIWVVTRIDLHNECRAYVTFYEENAKKQVAQIDGRATMIKYKFDQIRSLSKKTKERIRDEITGRSQKEKPKKIRRVRQTKTT